MYEDDKGHPFSALLRPNAVAIVGASANKPTLGNRQIKILQASGFSGKIYVLHPKADEIEGVQAYRSFQDIPEVIDYCFVCVEASSVPDLVHDANGKVRFMQVITSGFGEVEQGLLLHERLQEALRNSRVRLLGPNCIGMHSGAGRISFIERTEFEEGATAVVSQSGGLSIDTLRRGQQMGIAFSSVISVGNSLDVDASELLRYHLQDPQVRVIGLYIENVRNGRALFETLRDACASKPIVILKGGMTGEGSKAAASHTGAIADDERVWRALAVQTGSVLVNDLSEFLNLLSLFQTYPRHATDANDNVVLIGNGGGISVLAADHFARHGISLYGFSDEVNAQLASLDVPAGSSLQNPIDVPANALSRNSGRTISKIFETLADCKDIGIVVMHLNLTVFAGYDSAPIIENAFNALVSLRDRLGDGTRIVFVARSDYSMDATAHSLAIRKKGIEAGIPVFDELADAAVALGAMEKLSVYRRRRVAIENSDDIG